MPRDTLHLETLTPDELRAHGGEKWQRYPDDVLPAWVAELDVPIAEPIAAVIRQALAVEDFGYPLDPRRSELPRVFAERMAERFSWHPDPDGVEVLVDVVQGVYLALETFSEPGDGVVIHTPIYPPFLHAVEEKGRRLVENRLLPERDGFVFDHDALRRSAASAKLLLLCSPHNPSGRVFSRRDLETLLELAIEHDWVVVSDEIHADLVYPGREHIPFASLGPEAAARCVTLTSATKAFNIPGLRCAVAVFENPELKRRFLRVPVHERGGISSLGLTGTVAAWTQGDPWRCALLELLARNRDHLASRLRRDFPGVGFHPPEASYLAWLDCRTLDLDPNPYRFFLDRGRVALSPGESFGDAGRGFVRLNFGTTGKILDEILDRMKGALATLLLAVAFFSGDAEAGDLWSELLAPQPSGLEIATQTNARDDGRNAVRRFSMDLIAEGGKVRHRSAKIFRRDDDEARRQILFFEEPPAIEGTALLTFDYPKVADQDDQWIYLPALRKSRRIATRDRGRSFLGTDFSFEDIKKETRISLEDYHFENLGEGEVDAISCWRLEATPVNRATAESLGYGRVLFWIDRERLIPRLIEYWTPENEALKALHLRDIRLVQDVWTAHEIEAHSQKSGHRTVIRFSEIAYGAELGEDLFSERALRRGAP